MAAPVQHGISRGSGGFFGGVAKSEAMAPIAAPVQDAWPDDAKKDIDEAMSCSPWRGIATRRPTLASAASGG